MSSVAVSDRLRASGDHAGADFVDDLAKRFAILEAELSTEKRRNVRRAARACESVEDSAAFVADALRFQILRPFLATAKVSRRAPDRHPEASVEVWTVTIEFPHGLETQCLTIEHALDALGKRTR
jgi:hypothetical protein